MSTLTHVLKEQGIERVERKKKKKEKQESFDILKTFY
jgi:hypothetical protein